MKLTKRQQLIVDAKGRDVLVSAAAGSGKTATMVEAVIDRVTDSENPVDIDKILMVTFSNMAANQMKDKIRKRLEELLSSHPESEHLARQLILVNRADISTIDRFCKKIVTENYDKAGIDAGFELAEKPVASVMQKEVLDSIFEREYAALINKEQEENERKNENKKSFPYADFGMLRNYLCKDNRDDDEFRKCIISLYYTAKKQPYPERWLKKVMVSTNIKSEDKLNKKPWMKELLVYQRHMNESILDDIEAARSIYDGHVGSEYFEAIVSADIEKVTDINNQSTYSLMRDAAAARWKTFSTKKKILAAGCPEYVVSDFEKKRDDYKKSFKKNFVLKSTVDEILAAYVGYRAYYVPLAGLTLSFMEEYDGLKKRRKLFEFHDISHMAYNLICEKNFQGKIVPTELAEKYSENYSYIFIDEYQDGDYIQEGILTGISRNHNMCMVGDVKQSIYGFRNARPEIFLEKYDRYTECDNLETVGADEKEIKILLNQNFRSRKNVLDATNFMFWQLMDKSLGGLDYGTDTMLSVGSPHPASPSDLKTEILVAKTYDEEGNVSRHSRETLETVMIVNKIKELLYGEEPMMVLREDYRQILSDNPDMAEEEKKEKLYRRAVPGDIAILLRSVKGMGEEIYNALNIAGIPVNIDNSEGYYEAVELRVSISLLQVIDNRYQDIPLEAVLVSPIAGLDENEMTLVAKYGRDEYFGEKPQKGQKKEHKKVTLYEKCEMFLLLFEKDENGEFITQKGKNVYRRASKKIKGFITSAHEKLNKFFELAEKYKRLSRELTVSELIWQLLDESGYYVYVQAMPDGERRRANLDKLIELSKGFENGVYKGLFRFIEYMKKIEVENVDVGEVSAGKSENAVRIMTMHKSKGLEFPIVFVSNLCRQLSGGGKDKLQFDNDYMVIGKYIDDVNRYLLENTCHGGVMTLIKARECAEEMRIFYVAMTRPMEKLYLTGCETADYANTISKSCDSLNLNSLRLPYSVRCSKNGYMYWVECCYARLKALATSDFSDGVKDETGKELFKNAAGFIIRQEYGFKELEKHIQGSVIGKTLNFESLIKEAKAYAYDKRVSEIKDEINFKYAYEPFTKIKNKYSISEIKKMMADEVSADDVDGERQDKVSTAEAGETVKNSSKEKNTDTAKSTGKISASERGTLVHKFLELLDFATLTEDLAESDYSALVKEALEALEDEGIYTEEEKSVIPVKKIAVFLTSSLGQRMIRAAKRNELFREKSFTKAFPVNELLKNEEVPGENDEIILVQGTIDAYFFEGEKAVLVDYKTDHKTPKQLIGLYHAQLEYYAKTIEALLDREVCERLIYSFHNNCEVRIPV